MRASVEHTLFHSINSVKKLHEYNIILSHTQKLRLFKVIFLRVYSVSLTFSASAFLHYVCIMRITLHLNICMTVQYQFYEDVKVARVCDKLL
jgi:hypothetical protein